MNRTPRNKGLGTNLRRLFFSGVVIAFALLLMEAGLRLTGQDRSQLSEDDPILGHRLRAGARSVQLEAGRESEVRINSIGYHDREYSAAKPQGTERVVVLGDSFTEARAVPVDSNFTKLTEGMFRADGRQVEVMNFGVSGYGTIQQWLLLQRIIPEFDPDFVVLMFYEGNDVRNNSPILDPRKPRPYLKKSEDGHFELDRSFLSGGDPLLKRAINAVADRSYLVAWAVDKYVRIRFKRNLRKAGGVGPLPLEYRTFGDDRPEAWEQAFESTLEALRRIQATCEKAGLGWLLVYIPSGLRIEDVDRAQWVRDYPAMKDLDWRKVEVRISSWLDRKEVPWTNLYGPLRRSAEESGDELYIAGWGHFTEAGHRVVARVLYKNLRDRLP